MLKLHFPIDSTEYVWAREQVNQAASLSVNGKWHLVEGSVVGPFGSSLIIALPEAVVSMDAVDPFEHLYGIVQVHNEIFGYWRRDAEKRVTHETRGLWKAVARDDGKLEVTILPESEPFLFYRKS